MDEDFLQNISGIYKYKISLIDWKKKSNQYTMFNNLYIDDNSLQIIVRHIQVQNIINIIVKIQINVQCTMFNNF